MSLIAISVRRAIGGAEVTFTAEADDLVKALAAAHTLAGMDTPAASSAPAADAKPAKAKAEGSTAEKPKAEAKKQTADSASSAPGATPATTAQPAAAQDKTSSTTDAQANTGAGEEVSYDQVKSLILTIASKQGRDKVTALLQRFGAAKGPELKQDQYAEFVVTAQKVLDGEYDPVAGEEALA